MFSYSEFIHEPEVGYNPYIEPISNEYKVTVNGHEVPVYTERISKISFNRVWPGYQRSGGQTVLVSYINLVSDEELDIKVTPLFDYKNIMIKPYSKKIDFVDNLGEVSFSIEKEGQYIFVADDFCHTLYIFNSKPIKAPAKDEVTYYFGPGIHMTDKITLHSNESVYVDKDALVYGCIHAKDAKNIRIFGNGIFDDSAEGRTNNNCYENYTNGNFKIQNCENVRVEGVGFKDSAVWCVSAFHCRDVVFDNIKVFGQWRYNTDGIDIVNSQDITIKNSFIHSFDDTIVIKGIDAYCRYNNEDILVESCVCWNDWGNTLEFGAETRCREYKNITFKNIDIIRAGNVALDINNGECAEIWDILFENINVEYNIYDSPTVYHAYEEMKYEPEEKTQIAYLIRFWNMLWRTEETSRIWNLPYPPAQVDLEGAEPATLHDIEVRNICVYYDEEIPKKDGRYNAPILIKSYRDGVKFRNISLKNIEINGEKIDRSNAILEVDEIDNFNIEN